METTNGLASTIIAYFWASHFFRTMLKGLIKTLIGDKSATDRKKYQPVVEHVAKIYPEVQKDTDDQLRGRTAKFRALIKNAIAGLEAEVSELKLKSKDVNLPLHEKETIYTEIDVKSKKINEAIEQKLEEILPEAFAVVKETARRWAENKQLVVTATDFDKELVTRKDGITIDGDKAIWSNQWTAAGTPVEWVMVHYDVQLIGGTVLHRGNIAEMQTGEGKTLVATLPVYLNALAGKGVHVVTVNDYLAKRDSEWMGPLYQFHGLSVDCIDKHQPNSPARRKAYNSDITFGTNNEFGFDYLRDNMASDSADLVQREHHFAIVDEVDSVLIDDARTPLIISGPTPKGDEHEFHELKPRVEHLVEAQRKYVNQALSDAKRLLHIAMSGQTDGTTDVKTALEEGSIALLQAHRGLPKNKALIKFLSEPGIRSQLQKVENQYMAEQGKHMKKIDKELFFVIDEKQNSVDMTEKGIDLISGKDDRNFFVMPDISTELAVLQKEQLPAEEYSRKKDLLIRDYSVKSERIHSITQLLKAYALFDKEVEYVIMDGKIKIVDEQTGRIMEGRRYSDGLHQAIEAKENVTVEAATQTYATVTLQNYFRMYHKLCGMTGTAETEAKEFWDIYKLDVVVIPTNRPISRKDQQDLVFKTAREKYAAVIDEVVRLVEAGRPVLVGTTTVEISELLSRMLKMRNINHQVLNAKYHQKEAEIVAMAGKAGAVTIATNMAGRGTDIKLGEGVKEAGGLAIVGTERHDSRRVDRQLRGRAGRQGDPGSSQFFVCLEDDLMRKFGSERIARVMDRLGLKEGEVISHSMVSKSIERAQKKVEENNFGVRKRLLEYDDVMNAQRKAIYKKRRNALFGERLDVDVSNMFYDVVENIVNVHSNSSFQDFELELMRLLGVDSPITQEQFNSISKADLIEDIYEYVTNHYQAKNERIASMILPQVKDIYANNSKFEVIVFDVTNGRKKMNIHLNIKEAVETNGKNIASTIERNLVLGMIDNEWKEHLREMDDLRSSVQQAVYEQKDPLLIYKLESFELFKTMMNRLSSETVEFLVQSDLQGEDGNKVQSAQKTTGNSAFDQSKTSSSSSNTPVPDFQGSQGYDEAMKNSMPQREKQQPVVAEVKIGRNDACPCGSGKKYKQCHGKD
jgi:preprotein translocase subunit SecA